RNRSSYPRTDPLRIVVDVTPLSLPRTGIGNYIRGMVAGLVEAAEGRHEIVAFAPTGPRGRRRVGAALAQIPVERRVWALPGAYYWRALWSRAGRPPVETVAGELDVFHFSDWMYPAQRGGVRAQTVRRDGPELLHAEAGAETPGGTGTPAVTGAGVQRLGFVSDEELARLYRGADAVAYPLLYQGFGIPIVEAMACRTAVVASDHP